MMRKALVSAAMVPMSAVALAAWLILGFAGTAAHADRALSVQPPSRTVNSGASFTLTVDIDDASHIAGFQFDLSYDVSLITLVPPVAAGSVLSGLAGWSFQSNVVNLHPDLQTVRVLAYNGSAVEISSGSGPLAAYTFEANGGASGTTAMLLENIVLSNGTGQGIPAVGTNGTVIVRPPNVPPTASFTYAPPSPTDLDVISFTDTSTDADGTVTAWQWSFGDGATSTKQHPTHQYADDGGYTATLVVTDNEGATSPPFTLTVPVANVAPTANFTYAPSSPRAGQSVAFTDMSTDADGSVTAWAWDFGDGATSTQHNPSHTFAAAGTYTVGLTVTDDDGATGSQSKPVVVSPRVSTPPTASFTYSPTSPTDLDTIAFTDTSTDSDGTVVSWAWNFGDRTTSTARNPSHRYANNGTYRVTLTVRDNDGASSAPFSRTIPVANVAPTAAFTFSPASPTARQTVAFTDRSTDPDGTISQWAWNFGDGSSSNKRSPTHAYSTGGAFTVRLTVTDNDGARATASQTITVQHICSVAIASFSVPSRARVGTTANLAVTVSNTGTLTTGVQVQVDRILPLPARTVGSQTVTLAPGAKVKVSFPYTFTAADVPSVTFRATATPLIPGSGATAQASTRVTR